MEISPKRIGKFDIVLFLGVLYHMRHPLLALQKVASVTKEMAIIETHLGMLEYNRPAMAFYPGKEAFNEQSNWCGPNVQAVEAMLKTVGFSKIKLHSQSPIAYRVDFKPELVNKNTENRIPTRRATFHAWK